MCNLKKITLNIQTLLFLSEELARFSVFSATLCGISDRMHLRPLAIYNCTFEESGRDKEIVSIQISQIKPRQTDLR